MLKKASNHPECSSGDLKYWRIARPIGYPWSRSRPRARVIFVDAPSAHTTHRARREAVAAGLFPRKLLALAHEHRAARGRKGVGGRGPCGTAPYDGDVDVGRHDRLLLPRSELRPGRCRPAAGLVNA